MSYKSLILTGIICSTVLLSFFPALLPERANAAQSKQSSVSMYVFREQLRTVIQEIARRDNISAKIENEIRRVVARKMLSGSRSSVLTRLATEYGLDWFEYNNTLYVSRRRERSTKFFPFNIVNIKRVLRRLNQAGANMESFQVQAIDRKTVSVSGPPGFLAIVETIIEAQQGKSKKIVQSQDVQLYKGVKLFKIEIEKSEKN